LTCLSPGAIDPFCWGFLGDLPLPALISINGRNVGGPVTGGEHLDVDQSDCSGASVFVCDE
jgi:hypothetical protein